MDTWTNNFFSEIEKLFEAFRIELGDKLKLQTEQYIAIETQVLSDSEKKDELQDLLAILDIEALKNLASNPDQLTQLMENLKESLETKIGEWWN